MTKEEIKNKEDFINYILIQLYEKVHPVDFGNFFMEVSLTVGVDSFRNLLVEPTENKLCKTAINHEHESPGLAMVSFTPHFGS